MKIYNTHGFFWTFITTENGRSYKCMIMPEALWIEERGKKHQNYIVYPNGAIRTLKQDVIVHFDKFVLYSEETEDGKQTSFL